MTTVSLNTIAQMEKEINSFKERLFTALENGTRLPLVNTDVILRKYIEIATQDLKKSMPLRSARKLAKNVLTESMLRLMK
jgi:hypothetical protein